MVDIREAKFEPLAYGLADAAAALGLGLSTFKELVRLGDIASVRVGRRRLVTRRELDRFLALREQEARLTDNARSQLQQRINELQQMLNGLGGTDERR